MPDLNSSVIPAQAGIHVVYSGHSRKAGMTTCDTARFTAPALAELPFIAESPPFVCLSSADPESLL